MDGSSSRPPPRYPHQGGRRGLGSRGGGSREGLPRSSYSGSYFNDDLDHDEGHNGHNNNDDVDAYRPLFYKPPPPRQSSSNNSSPPRNYSRRRHQHRDRNGRDDYGDEMDSFNGGGHSHSSQNGLNSRSPFNSPQEIPSYERNESHSLDSSNNINTLHPNCPRANDYKDMQQRKAEDSRILRSSSQSHSQLYDGGYHSDFPSGYSLHRLSAESSSTYPCSGDGMVLSKMQESGNPTPPSGEIVSFLREFKTLECSCCDQLMGFQHRNTGILFCTPGCNGKGKTMPEITTPNSVVIPQSPAPVITKAPALIQSPAPVVIKSPALVVTKSPHPVINKAPAPVIAKLPPPVINKATAPVIAKSPPPVINKAPPVITNSSDPVVMVNASSIRKTKVNPFFRNIPSTPAGLDEGDNSSQPETKTAPKVADMAQDKPMAEPEIVRASLPPRQKPVEPEVKRVPPAEELKRYMWQECKFSESLKGGAMVKASFVWSVGKLQIMADVDENKVMKFQDKLTNIHLKAVKPLTQPPVIDQMVLGEYKGDYYRGRVTRINKDRFHVVFVDFGDAAEMPYTSMYPVTDYLMDDPIYSATVVLDGVPEVNKKVKPGKRLNDLYYSSLQLEMIDEIVVNEKESYRVMLWMSKTENLNDVVAEVIGSTDELSQNINEQESGSMARIEELRLSDKESIRIAQIYRDMFHHNYNVFLNVKRRMAKAHNANPANKDVRFKFKFSLHDTKTTFTAKDTVLPDIEQQQPFEAMVGNAKGLDAIFVAPIGQVWDEDREIISREAERYIMTGQAINKTFKNDGSTGDMFIVKWCPWDEAYYFLERMKWTLYRKRAPPRFEEPIYAPMRQKNNKWVGKWFRAFFTTRVTGDNELNENDCCWYCLIDIGVTIAVPNKFVYRINGHLMRPPIGTFRIRLILNGVHQFLPYLDNKCKYLFEDEPNMKIKFVPLEFDDRTTNVILIEPTEKQFLKELKLDQNADVIDDIARLREEFSRIGKLTHLDNLTEDTKEMFLSAIKESFAKMAEKERGSIKLRMTPFLSAKAVKLGGFTDMKAKTG